MIEPKEITIDGKTFIISKLPAVAGREILMRYPKLLEGGISDYRESEQLMYKLLRYVSVRLPNGAELPLNTEDLINNHTGNALTLVKLEKEMLDYSFGFFSPENRSDSP